MTITELLDDLRAAFSERGRHVDRHLQPGLPAEELLRRTGSLGLTPPEDVIELYAWRDGQGADAEMSPDAFRFRDNTFVDVAGSLREYPLIQEHHAPEPDSIPYCFELRETFPIATCPTFAERSRRRSPRLKNSKSKLLVWAHFRASSARESSGRAWGQVGSNCAVCSQKSPTAFRRWGSRPSGKCTHLI